MTKNKGKLTFLPFHRMTHDTVLYLQLDLLHQQPVRAKHTVLCNQTIQQTVSTRGMQR
jgi:hypothetical protein